jgi:hypothetical protein
MVESIEFYMNLFHIVHLKYHQSPIVEICILYST